jgi:hypothetical protein
VHPAARIALVSLGGASLAYGLLFFQGEQLVSQVGDEASARGDGNAGGGTMVYEAIYRDSNVVGGVAFLAVGAALVFVGLRRGRPPEAI